MREDIKRTLQRIQVIGKMRFDLPYFAEVIFPSVEFTRQQREFMVVWSDLLKAKNDLHGIPVGSASRRLETYRNKFGVSISAGQGTGKDFISAVVLWHFMFCFSRPNINAVATSGSQSRSVFWREVQKLASLSRLIKVDGGYTPILEHYFEILDKEVRLRQRDTAADKLHVARRKSPKITSSVDEQGETFAGSHEENMLFIIDEASKLPEGIFKPVEGTLTGRINVSLLIFNPTQSQSYAVRTITDQKLSKLWIPLRWSGEECERITSDHILRMRERFGILSGYKTVLVDGEEQQEPIYSDYETTSGYRVRVLGLPPIADEDALLPWNWLQKAKARGEEFYEQGDNIFEAYPDKRVMAGLDVGGAVALNVFIARIGDHVFHIQALTPEVRGKLVDWVVDLFHSCKVYQIGIDATGVGDKVVIDLQERLGLNPDGTKRVNAVYFQGSGGKFRNRRTRCYFEIRRALEDNKLILPSHDDLISELSLIKVEAGSMPIGLSPKNKKKSPNFADALALSYFRDAVVEVVEKPQEVVVNPFYEPSHPSISKYASRYIPRQEQTGSYWGDFCG